MLGSIRPIASLSSGLLARKGQARPAMRPQGFAGATAPASTADDLGWNDMGTPDPVSEAAPEPSSLPAATADLPPVLVERSALVAEVARVLPPEAAVGAEAEPAAVEPAEIAAMELVRRHAGQTGKAAFTLRLPAERHLKLRLAAAVSHRSAQAIVTEALDAFLSTLPEVEELAARCSAPDRLGNRS